tara:strand:- start:252 stop:404 length:153 start_codon:yes stop_codon:yes gene_type:complete
MSTPRDLIKSTWARYKEYMLLNGRLEDYVLFTIAKLLSFSAGIGIGYYYL